MSNRECCPACDRCDSVTFGRHAERAEILAMLRERIDAAGDVADMLDEEGEAAVDELIVVLGMIYARGKETDHD